MIMNNKKKVALVAHDNMKRDLAEWVDWNWEVLLKHHLICTGTTGKMVEKTLRIVAAASFGRTTWTLRCSSRVRSEAISSSGR